MIPVLSTEQHWTCPNCTETALTKDSEPRFHNCRGLKGLTAPMVLEGVRCKVEAIERADYVGKAIATYDGEGRPVCAVVTTREDGTDLVVNADAAAAGVRID